MIPSRARNTSARLASVLAAVSLAACAATGAEAQEDGPPVSDREVVIDFTGLAHLSRDDLLDAVADELVDFRRSGFEKWTIDDAAYRMVQKFASEGYPFAAIDYSLEVPEQGPVRVDFEVEPGPRTRLVGLRFQGVRAYSPETVRAFFGLDGPEDRVLYVRSAVSSAIGALEERYLNDGYVDVGIQGPETTFSEDRTEATVSFVVDEGSRFVVRSVDVGVDVEELEEPLRERLGEARGSTFRLRLPFELRAALVSELGERGYIRAEIEQEVERDADTGATEIRFDVQAGEKVIVDAIEVRGNEETRTSTIVARLAVEPGDVYTYSAERTSFERLYRLGVFRGVRVFAEKNEAGEWICVVEVDEDRTTDFFVEPGYGSYERLRVTVGYRERNLFGRAIPFRAEVTGGQFAVRGEAGVAQPGLFGIHPDLTGEFKLFAERREEPSFTEEELGFATGASYRWSRSLTSAFEYQFRRSDVVEATADDPDALDAFADIDISSIAVSTSFDERDHVFLPTTGGSSRISLEVADAELGSELNFTRLVFSQTLFRALGETTILAFGWQFGMIMPHGSTVDIPLQERFFNGGESSVRSFAEDELGPKDGDGDPLGGEAYSVFSAEVRQEIAGPLGAALFVDFGGLAEEGEDVFEFSSIETGIGVGAGVRYFLPIGPVRLDVGVNPDPAAGEDDVVAHLSVGMAF